MHRLKYLKTAALAVLVAAQAQALDWEHQFSGSPLDYLHDNEVDSSPDYTYGGLFNLTLDGFNPATMTITSAKAYFAFADDDSGDPAEYVDILLGGTSVVLDEEVDGAHPWANYDWVEVTLSPALLTALDVGGQLSFEVQLQDFINRGSEKKEDTYLKVAKLKAWGIETPPPPTETVPDAGATFAMLGLGFAGLAALRKRVSLRA